MKNWSKEIEDEMMLFLKDWLKQQGRTQADLKKQLNAETTRMPALIEVIKKEYSLGGMKRVASLLCSIEEDWSTPQENSNNKKEPNDPLGQLDLILEELDLNL